MGGNVTNTLADRGKVYGSFHGNAFVSQELKRTLQSGTGWPKLSDTQKEALELICTKIGRIMTGDPSFIDNWHDITGYASLVEESLVFASAELPNVLGQVKVLKPASECGPGDSFMYRDHNGKECICTVVEG